MAACLAFSVPLKVTQEPAGSSPFALGKSSTSNPVSEHHLDYLLYADFTGLMFFEARFVASLRIADKPEGGDCSNHLVLRFLTG